MTEQSFIVGNPDGLHARPANEIMEAAKAFASRISLAKGDVVANARSLIGMLKLGAKPGERIVVTAEGEDEAEAVRAIGEIIRSNAE